MLKLLKLFSFALLIIIAFVIFYGFHPTPKEEKCVFLEQTLAEMQASKTENVSIQFKNFISDCDEVIQTIIREFGTEQGSMYPTIKLGDFVCFKNVSYIEVGDIVPYSGYCLNRSGLNVCECGVCPIILHRVVKIFSFNGENIYLFKGDNNPKLDLVAVPDRCVYKLKATKKITCENGVCSLVGLS